MGNYSNLTAIFMLGLFTFNYLQAQQIVKCGTAEYIESLLNDHPYLQDSAAKMEQLFQEYQVLNPLIKRSGVITIPVVVHIVHDGDNIGISENISDAQILSQIEVLNEDFRRLNSDAANTPSQFQSIAADFEIEFCLAQRDPDGNPTNGIERINGGRSSWTKALADTLKKSTIWNSDEYLNIWVLRLGGSNSSTLGYSSLPPFNFDPFTDGIVVDYKAFGKGPYDLIAGYEMGRTTTHEVGHWLGLRHIWGDDNGLCPNDSGGDDDGVSDTPGQGNNYFGCPSWPQISCGSADMFMNFMDYTDDDCANLFTEGQKSRAIFVLGQYRSGIASSEACVPLPTPAYDVALSELVFPTQQVCFDNFNPVVRVTNMGSETITSILLNYIIDSTDFNQHQWTGSILPFQSVNIWLPRVSLSLGQHTIYIFLSNPNGKPDENNNNNESARVFNINSIGIGQGLPLFEDFEGAGSLPAGWQLENPDGDRTWEVSTEASYNGTQSFYFDNFTGTAANNPGGKLDAIVTPELDFRNRYLPVFIFNVAYARRNVNSKDSLKLYYSVDCGDTWIKAWAKGNASLSTANDVTTKFVPSGDEWREEKIYFDYLSGYAKVIFKIENESDWGNAVYIDDVLIRETGVGLGEMYSLPAVVTAYPNPAISEFHLYGLNFEQGRKYDLGLYDVLGREVLTSQLSGSQSKVIVRDLNSGVYLFTIKAVKAEPGKFRQNKLNVISGKILVR